MIRHPVLSLLLLLAACSGGSGSSDAPPAPVALVSLASATTGSVQQMLTVYGVVQKDSTARYALSTPVEAIVDEIANPVGSAVRAGTVVARLQASPGSRAAMRKSASDARAASEAYARAQRLRADGLASDADVESARSAAIAAQAQQAAMTRRARDLTLRARAEGHVETVPVNPGDLLAPGSTVATLTRTGAQRAGFGVDPRVAGGLAPGTPIGIASSSGGKSLNVPIESIDTTVDSRTRLATVFARIPAGARLAPGQPLVGHVPIATRSDALTIPYAALLDDGGQPYVFVVSKGVAHRHDVVIGPSSGERIVIDKGVSSGDQVVTAGGTALEDGMKVRSR
ncbi:MAG: efflux RND transporter periplasmic adaptor subunit [Betaproteobacteria bacterium]|nr:efflux RND transporter periplasmic adaptor subunit [Betaproteobacteria bacterium]